MGKPWPGPPALTNKLGTAACVSHQEETEALGTEVLGGGQRHWETKILERQTEALGYGGNGRQAQGDGGTGVPRYWETQEVGDRGTGRRRHRETEMADSCSLLVSQSS